MKKINPRGDWLGKALVGSSPVFDVLELKPGIEPVSSQTGQEHILSHFVSHKEA